MSKAKEWPATKPEMRQVADLMPYARNARRHSPEQIEKIARSIQEFGWTNPVLINEAGGIIAGHGRILAAQHLNIREVPVIVAVGWTDAQQRAYVIADNKLALEAGWDRETLALEFAELKALDFDLTLTGFDDDPSVGGSSVTRLETPQAIEFAWALIGVPIASMGELAMMVEKAQTIDGAIVEVADDKKRL
tara:strand:+ start:9295 stop:9870 length:576 start_codon:yes stop_codon:yes gene_type:complete